MGNNANGFGETHSNLAIRQTVVAGAAAGIIAIPGWIPGSSLKSVVDITTPADLTAAFKESPTGMTNAGGSTTAGKTLLVLWIAMNPKGAPLTRGT